MVPNGLCQRHAQLGFEHWLLGDHPELFKIWANIFISVIFWAKNSQKIALMK